MPDCPFCIDQPSVREEIVHADDHCYVIETGDPVLRDAVMIIPFRHVATPFDLTADEWASTRRLLRWARIFLEERGPQGYSIGWNVHEVGGQTVPHVHLHVIARFADEPLAGKGICHAFKHQSNRGMGWQ